MGRRLRRIAVVLGILVLVWGAIVVSIQRWFVFPRHLVDAPPGAGREVPGLQRLSLAIPEGQVEAWYLPGEGVSARRPGPAVIFAHGNAELIDHWPGPMAAYRRLGISVLLPEYRGYGRSAGAPSQRAITRDLVELYDRLAGRPEVDAERIVLHGRSIGGGAICALAAHRRPRAIIVQSTFTSLRALARRYLVPGFLVRDPFDNLAVLRELDVPLLVVHGTRDRLVPVEHGRRLARAAPRATLVTYDADHNDCPPDWPRFFADVAAFLRRAEVLP